MPHPKAPNVPLSERLAWNVGEFAGLAGWSPAFVWKLIKSGKLNSLKIGNRRVIPRAAGLELLQSSDHPEAA